MPTLREHQKTVPTHLLSSLASASALGSGSLLSHDAKLAKQEDKNVRRLLERTSKRRKIDVEASSSSEEEEDWETGKAGPIRSRPEEEEPIPESAQNAFSGVEAVDIRPATKDIAVGGALKKREDGSLAIKQAAARDRKGKGKGKMVSSDMGDG